jgi:hypothetical protein
VARWDQHGARRAQAHQFRRFWLSTEFSRSDVADSAVLIFDGFGFRRNSLMAVLLRVMLAFSG